jgi:DNA-directed RNA polymerase specialized sigma24 family protein
MNPALSFEHPLRDWLQDSARSSAESGVSRNFSGSGGWISRARRAGRHAVGKLERTDREILLLREFEQLTYAEIAELLSLPVNTVRSRLFRARTALHNLLVAPAPKASTAELAESEERV